MLKKMSALCLTLLLLLSSVAYAAPTVAQVDKAAAYSKGGHIAEYDGRLYYAHGQAIYSMTRSGGDRKKVINADRAHHFQVYNGYLYYINVSYADDVSRLYRYKPGVGTKLVRNDVFEAVFVGDILYYTTGTRDNIYAWNMKTNKITRKFNRVFSNTCQLNNINGMLVFTAKPTGKNSALYIFSSAKNSATYYIGMVAQGFFGYGNYYYGVYNSVLKEYSYNASTNKLTLRRNIANVSSGAIIISSGYAYSPYFKSDGSGYYQKVSLSTGKSSVYYPFTSERPPRSLQPAAGTIWAFNNNADGRPVFYKRLPK